MAEGTDYEVSSPLLWGMGDAYAVCGASMCPWDMGGGVGAHWGPPVLSSMTSERIQRSPPELKPKGQICPFFPPEKRKAMHPKYPDGAEVQGVYVRSLKGQPKQ